MISTGPNSERKSGASARFSPRASFTTAVWSPVYAKLLVPQQYVAILHESPDQPRRGVAAELPTISGPGICRL
jgi:hypothetical protein